MVQNKSCGSMVIGLLLLSQWTSVGFVAQRSSRCWWRLCHEWVPSINAYKRLKWQLWILQAEPLCRYSNFSLSTQYTSVSRDNFAWIPLTQRLHHSVSWGSTRVSCDLLKQPCTKLAPVSRWQSLSLLVPISVHFNSSLRTIGDSRLMNFIIVRGGLGGFVQTRCRAMAARAQLTRVIWLQKIGHTTALTSATSAMLTHNLRAQRSF